jgi:hypothetical protein
VSILADKLLALAVQAESEALKGVGFIWGAGMEAYIVVTKADIPVKSVFRAMQQEICPEDFVKPEIAFKKRAYVKRKFHESTH